MKGFNNGYFFYFVSWCESLIINYNYNLFYKIIILFFKFMECYLIIFLIIKVIYVFFF